MWCNDCRPSRMSLAPPQTSLLAATTDWEKVHTSSSRKVVFSYITGPPEIPLDENTVIRTYRVPSASIQIRREYLWHGCEYYLWNGRRKSID
jgi:hypothetical protein